jgi:hypothetical protein
MLHHIVMIEVNKDTPDDHLQAFRERLMAMPDTIPEIKAIDVRLDELHTTRSWDVLLHVQFENQEALEAYLIHPDHQSAVAFNRDYQTNIAVLDYTD